MTSLFNSTFSNYTGLEKATTNNRRFLVRQIALAAGLFFALNQATFATTFDLPKGNDALIDNNKGKPLYVKAKQEDSLIDIAVQYLLGQEEIVRANKNVDRWLPGEGKDVLIPTSYILPDAPRQGVVINLPEYRLYYYPPTSSSAAVVTKKATSKKKSTLKLPSLTQAPVLDLQSLDLPAIPAPPPIQRKVVTYAVGIGRVDWKTPLGVTRIVGKVKDPVWTPPASIKAEHLAKGDPLPDVWAAGPDNPLGLFAFRLGIPGYLLHSTNKPQGVGMQVSHGCMRLYPKDIEKMFPMVPVGTSVNIINQPVKVGWSNGALFIESHPNLEGEETSYQQRLDIALSLIEKARSTQPVAINGEILRVALEESNGIPTIISDNKATPIGPENPDQEQPELSPTESSDGAAVPKSQIEKELQQEEMQDRQFQNSPFPSY